MRDLSFRQRQLLVLLALALVPLAVMLAVVLPSSRDTIYQRATAQLEAVAELKSVQVRQWFDHGREVARLVATRRQVQADFPALTYAWEQDHSLFDTEDKASRELRAELNDLTVIFHHLQSISLLHPHTGQVLLATDRRLEGRDRGDEVYFQAGQQGLYVSSILYSVGHEAPILTVSAPVHDENGRRVAVVAVEMDLTDLQATLDSRAGLGRTGRAYLVDAYGFYVTLPSGLQENPLRTIAESEGVHRALAQQSGSEVYRDPRGVPVLGVYRWLPYGNLGLLVEIEEAELIGRVRQRWMLIIATSLGLLVLGVVAARYLANWLVGPLERIVQAARSLRAGELGHRVPSGGSDEVGQLARAFNEMADSLQLYSENLEQLVAQRTGELRTAVEQLEREISERRRAEEHYRSVVEYSHAGILIVDDAFHFVYANDELCRILGYPRREILGRDFRRFLDDAYRDLVANHYLRRREGEDVSPRYEARIVRKDGQKRDIEIIATLISDATEGVRSVGQILDITERKRAEAELLQRNAELAAQNAIAATISQSLDLGAILDAALDKVLEMLEAEGGGIHLVEPEDKAIRLHAHRGLSHELVEAIQDLPWGTGITGQAIVRGEPLVLSVSDYVEADYAERFAPFVDQQGWQTLASVPLISKGEVLGGLTLVARRSWAFPPQQLTLLAAIGQQIGVAVENARLLGQAHRDTMIKTTLLNEVNHRVKNNLASILGILSLELRRPLDDAADFQAALLDVQNRVWGIATVHDLLSASQWAPLSIAELVSRVVQGALSNSPIRHQIRLSITLPPRELWLVSRQATALALVLNELTTNSIKHAFVGRGEGSIDIEITLESALDEAQVRDGDASIRVEFRDNGPGWPQDVLEGKRESVGLRLLRLNVRSPLLGELTMFNDGGAVAVIRFRQAPVDSAEPEVLVR